MVRNPVKLKVLTHLAPINPKMLVREGLKPTNHPKRQAHIQTTKHNHQDFEQKFIAASFFETKVNKMTVDIPFPGNLVSYVTLSPQQPKTYAATTKQAVRSLLERAIKDFKSLQPNASGKLKGNVFLTTV